MHKKRLNDFKLERMRRMQAVDQVINISFACFAPSWGSITNLVL